MVSTMVSVRLRSLVVTIWSLTHVLPPSKARFGHQALNLQISPVSCHVHYMYVLAWTRRKDPTGPLIVHANPMATNNGRITALANSPRPPQQQTMRLTNCMHACRRVLPQQSSAVRRKKNGSAVAATTRSEAHFASRTAHRIEPARSFNVRCRAPRFNPEEVCKYVSMDYQVGIST